MDSRDLTELLPQLTTGRRTTISGSRTVTSQLQIGRNLSTLRSTVGSSPLFQCPTVPLLPIMSLLQCNFFPYGILNERCGFYAFTSEMGFVISVFVKSCFNHLNIQKLYCNIWGNKRPKKAISNGRFYNLDKPVATLLLASNIIGSSSEASNIL